MYRLLLEYIETFNEDFPLSKLGHGYSEYEVCSIITDCLTLNKPYNDDYEAHEKEPPKEAEAIGATEATGATTEESK